MRGEVKPVGKRPLERWGCRWEDNEIRCEGVRWIYLAQERDLKCACVSKGSVAPGFVRDRDFLTGQAAVGFSEKWSDVWRYSVCIIVNVSTANKKSEVQG